MSSSCSLAQKSNYCQIVAFNVFITSSCPWIIDSGASNPMIGCSKLFSSYSLCARNRKIKIVNGSLLVIDGKRSIVISKSFILHYVFHVPNFSYNILFISKPTYDLKSYVKFFSTHCEF